MHGAEVIIAKGQQTLALGSRARAQILAPLLAANTASDRVLSQLFRSFLPIKGAEQ